MRCMITDTFILYFGNLCNVCGIITLPEKDDDFVQLHKHKGNFLRDGESQKLIQFEFCQYVIQSWCQMTQKVCLNSYVVLNDDQKIIFYSEMPIL